MQMFSSSRDKRYVFYKSLLPRVGRAGKQAISGISFQINIEVRIYKSSGSCAKHCSQYLSTSRAQTLFWKMLVLVSVISTVLPLAFLLAYEFVYFAVRLYFGILCDAMFLAPYRVVVDIKNRSQGTVTSRQVCNLICCFLSSHIESWFDESSGKFNFEIQSKTKHQLEHLISIIFSLNSIQIQFKSLVRFGKVNSSVP